MAKQVDRHGVALIAAIVVAVSGAVSDDAPLPWWMSLVISVIILPAVGLVMKEIVGDAAGVSRATAGPTSGSAG